MRAVRFHEFGTAEVLVVEEIPEPRAAEGQVAVQVSAAGVNFADTIVRSGCVPIPLPFTAGFEVVGEADGQRVIGSTMGGGYAEHVVLSAALPVPDELDDHTALAVFGNGAAALGIVGAARVQSGETVFVDAAAGGVGSLVVQLAKSAGATVIAGVGSAGKVEQVRALGADRVVDYLQSGWTENVGPVHIVLDTVGGSVATAAFTLLVPSVGRIVLAGTSSGEPPNIEPAAVLSKSVSVIGYASALLPPEQQAELRVRALELGRAGDLKPILGQVFPLDRAADAHRAVESRATVGKVILQL
ncbi:quinone oxidoreductase family protein [Antrihabitans cavernicola]|uniref:Zinc-binding dehydrogenase n=1 Tax=Antrihabitans cavernicola TaxID=2495913 RepID=A0A5A7S6L2_9NOCA|nr:zinc-binding dehydrogenase [Spelaeibacter cavernicola]KAA0021760.1 zinc-binding dehydrogenase [Spelaeibacter cavernicola]